ncbi:hypothetical protein M405DRAFT_818480 [Rhizopogon salebrosus TDB-379]|nr:hypothetical protein M405DRAFT_818480 [Rhizopogon salebrosus TDB-379]
MAHPISIYAIFHPTSLLAYGLHKKQSKPLNVNIHSSLINSILMQLVVLLLCAVTSSHHI